MFADRGCGGPISDSRGERGGEASSPELPERCHLEVDRVQIERMISNLLTNALKFTPRGGEVSVALRDKQEYAEIVVADTGRGIAAEHLPHIFDRFYRVKSPSAESAPEKGLGLGLSFVAWIAKAHGGRVDVRSSPGKGTVFTIQIPNHPRSGFPLEEHQSNLALKQV